MGLGVLPGRKRSTHGRTPKRHQHINTKTQGPHSHRLTSDKQPCSLHSRETRGRAAGITRSRKPETNSGVV